MRYPSSSANRSRSRGDRYTRYSLGAYMRETEYDLCSSISRASLRAISTGRTSDLKARLKVPSTRPAILLSMLLSTVIERPRSGCSMLRSLVGGSPQRQARQPEPDDRPDQQE